MAHILLIIVGYLCLKMCWKLLRHFLSPSNTGFWLLVLGLLFIPHCAWLSVVIVVCRYVVAPILRYQEKHPASRQRDGGSTNWNTVVMLAIPLFWPFLLLKLFAKDKTLPNDNRPFDYEQHEKCNGR